MKQTEDPLSPGGATPDKGGVRRRVITRTTTVVTTTWTIHWEEDAPSTPLPAAPEENSTEDTADAD